MGAREPGSVPYYSINNRIGQKMSMTAAEIMVANNAAAIALPIETKKTFWRAMLHDHKNLGEAREIAGIVDSCVAAALVIQLHDIRHIPMAVEDIKD